jgi:hypothetical protein
MASWILIAAAQSLFDAFNELAPNRDHASDGSIGDEAHREEVSDHNPDETGKVPIHDADHINEVHAIDVDNNLNVPDLDMEYVVQFILLRCRSGAERRLRYIIYNRRIWEADNGWKQRVYTGASAHTEHVHFSFSYTTELEASTVSWHLEDIPVALTDADKNWISQQIRAPYTDTDKTGLSETEVGHDTLSQQVPNGTKPGNPQEDFYEVIRDMGIILVEISEKLDTLTPKPVK